MITKYRLYNYDVWGNEKDGFDINDVFKTSEIYELEFEETDKQIIKTLKKQGCIKKTAKNSKIEIEDNGGDTLYFSYKGKPEFELRPEKD